MLATLCSVGPLVVSAGEPLQVVFSGIARSGTNSLAAALRRLGYRTCQPMDVMGHPDLVQAVIDRDVDKIIEKTEEHGYNATLENHSPFWREIMARRPDAKYVFVTRETDKWMRSLNNTYWLMAPMVRYPFRLFPWFDRVTHMLASMLAQGLRTGRLEDGWKHLHDPFDPEEQEKLTNILERYIVESPDAYQGKGRCVVV